MNINLKITELKAALECAATKDVRYYLKCVCIDVINESEVMIISTNGEVLFACHADIDNMTTESLDQIIIDSETVKQAIKQCDKKQTYIFLKSLANNLYQLGNIVFTPVDVKYPDYRRVIPTITNGETAQFKTENIMAISKAICLYQGTKYEPELKYNGNSASVMVSNNGKAICVIMPMRKDTRNFSGFVLPKPKLEAAA